jgi:hypothetical protein
VRKLFFKKKDDEVLAPVKDDAVIGFVDETSAFVNPSRKRVINTERIKYTQKD